MRKLLVGLGLMAAVAAAIAIESIPSNAQQQQTPPPAQQAAAPPSKNAAFAAVDSSKLKGPKQPIFFRHDIHAGKLQMQCQYCHYSVNVSSEPGIPSMQTCMGCHIGISGSTPENKIEIKKLTTAWSKQQPVEWVRIHSLGRFVRFPHSQHIKALGPNACATCHGNIAQMPQVFRVNNVNNMGFCINCHLERKVTRDCTTCHY